MSQTVYIVAAKRSAVTRAKKGGFAKKRPDELLAAVIKNLVHETKIDPSHIEDVIIGCAFPEGEQGQNVARIASLLADLPVTVPGITVNRYCSSGLNSVAMGANMIASGNADVILAGGIESMSCIPLGGKGWSVSPEIFKKSEHIAIAYGMGITAELVAEQYNISRLAQDEFALHSHEKAIAAINKNMFTDEIVPLEVYDTILDENTETIIKKSKIITNDDGARADTTLAALAKLKSVFMTGGTVTAGNSSQTSDGAACLLLVSEKYLKEHNLKPLGKFIGFSVSGVDPKIMGIGPITAIPKALAKTGLNLSQIDWIELNEAFAAQSLAVINTLKLDTSKINPYGGAIALGHPLGATGAILTTKALHGLRRNNKKYGMITMCIGTGMGAAGIIESC